jgi:hypothetical protein
MAGVEKTGMCLHLISERVGGFHIPIQLQTSSFSLKKWL